MKKVLLVTLQGDNIGNRLQNYALQSIIEKMGNQIWTPYCDMNEFELLRSKLKFNVKSFLGLVGLEKFKRYYYRKKRIAKYQKFNQKYIKNMFRINYSKVFNENWNDFDYAVTGSDQVWHRWSVNPDELRYYYLEFIDPSKRISYAASFGFSEIPNDDLHVHKEGIMGMKYISCREKNGLEIVKKLTGKQSKYVLDPTLLLDVTDWKKIAKRPDWIDNRDFILVYFLDSSPNGYYNEVRKFAEENNLEIVNAYDVNCLNSQLITPDEFIWLINQARYVCTDSFHASVFSIIFSKKFLSFKRKDKSMNGMFDRIEDLLSLFGLNSRIYDGDMKSIDDDYEKKSICNIREESLEYLKEVLTN